MAPLFLFGTLRHRPLLEIVLGGTCPGFTLTPATLAGYGARSIAGESFPMLVAAPGETAEGLLLEGANQAAMARLDFYEGGYGYALRGVRVQTAAGQRDAQAYFPDSPGAMTPGGGWDLDGWIARWGAVTTLAAEEVMDGFGIVPAEVVARRYPSILARAASRRRARAARRNGPAALRRRVEPGDVVLSAQRQPFAGFFAIEEYELTHRRFDGAMSPRLTRETFVATDAATLLPYDPVRDRVMLVEQFRAGPLARGDPQCWTLEAIAGRIDADETPEQAIRREAREEAGLEIGVLHPLAGYYPSPGAVSEYIHSFIGLTDLPDTRARLGGAPQEGEDIRAHVIGFERAMKLLDDGALENAPLVLSLLWLARMREDLRRPA